MLKFSTKHEHNPFTLNCYMVPRTFLFIFQAGSHRLGSNNFQNSSYKEKRPVRSVFPAYLSVSYNYACTNQNFVLAFFLKSNVIFTLKIRAYFQKY